MYLQRYARPGLVGTALRRLLGSPITGNSVLPRFVHSDQASAQHAARETMTAQGYDPASFWEQSIVWGDQDPFQHVNNVQYLRYFESGRIQWLTSIGTEIGGPAKALAMSRGQGISLILKSIEVKFKRPVTFPDTLLIAHKPHRPNPTDPVQFGLRAAAYSYAQRAVVAESDCVLVWYDYDALSKCDPGPEMRALLEKRISLQKVDEANKDGKT